MEKLLSFSMQNGNAKGYRESLIRKSFDLDIVALDGRDLQTESCASSTQLDLAKAISSQEEWLGQLTYRQRENSEYRAIESDRFRIHESCQTGNPNLNISESKISLAISQGISCWNKLSAARKRDSRNLVGLIEGSVGRGIAVTSMSPIFPDVFLNSEANLTEAQFERTFFHELSHLLGNAHKPGQSFDVPSLTDQCCFDERADTSKASCRALFDLPDF
jgi:hypothetical protein